jgi:hypothetical protein
MEYGETMSVVEVQESPSVKIIVGMIGKEKCDSLISSLQSIIKSSIESAVKDKLDRGELIVNPVKGIGCQSLRPDGKMKCGLPMNHKGKHGNGFTASW